MIERKAMKLIRDPYVLIPVAVGLMLMALTVYFRVNPAEGSVVHESIRGTVLHDLLLFTTMPAYVAAMLIGNTAWVSYVLMFVLQSLLYAFLGLLLRLLAGRFWPK